MERVRRRGWVVFGMSLFLLGFIGTIWAWFGRVLASGGEPNAATLLFIGRLGLAFSLVIVGGVLGTINGWMMIRSGRRLRWMLFGALILFLTALVIALTATNAYNRAGSAGRSAGSARADVPRWKG